MPGSPDSAVPTAAVPRRRRRGVLVALALMIGAALSPIGASPAYADPATISGAVQFPAGMNGPDIEPDFPTIAVFDRGDDEIHYELLAVHDDHSPAIEASLSWDVDTSQLRWSVTGAGSATYVVTAFWSRWVYTGPIPKQQDSKQFWLSASSTTLLEGRAQATTYTAGTSPAQFHCAYGFEGCASGGGGNTPAVVPGTPRISGTARVGERLSVSAGAWQPAATNLSYQWLRDGAKIASATATTYQPTAADVGRRLSVAVTGSLVGYTTQSATSAQTAPVVKGQLSASKPRISGTPKVGRKLTADASAWGPAGVVLSYQWYAAGKKIAHATKPTYKIAKSLKGKKISVKVTGSKAGYDTATKASAASKKVKS